MRRSMLAALGILLLAAPVVAQRPEEVVRWRAVGPAAAVKAELSADYQCGFRLHAEERTVGGFKPPF